MEQYLEDIKKASLVEEGYKIWIDKHYKEKYENNPTQWVRMKESVFCYEFYKNLRENWKKESVNSARYKDLYFNAEITKWLSKDDYSYPDFVLHGGQDNTDKQLIAIEVKVSERIPDNETGNNNLINDIKVIIQYVEDEKLKYKMGLFIAVNMVTNVLRKRIENVYYLDKNNELKKDDKTLGKIYFIGTNSENEEIEHFTLLDVKKKLNKE